MAKPTIKDTDKSRNIEVPITDNLSVHAMELLLNDVSTELGLIMSHVTTLSRKKYPNNRHWHFKKDLKAKGCLDVTYWPEGPLFWVTIRNYEPAWVHRSGRKMANLIEEKMTNS